MICISCGKEPKVVCSSCQEKLCVGCYATGWCTNCSCSVLGRLRKLPIEISGFQYIGKNEVELTEQLPFPLFASPEGHVMVTTDSAPHRVVSGDWVLRGVNGEWYPCKEDVFNKTYRRVT